MKKISDGFPRGVALQMEKIYHTIKYVLDPFRYNNLEDKDTYTNFSFLFFCVLHFVEILCAYQNLYKDNMGYHVLVSKRNFEHSYLYRTHHVFYNIF